MRLNEVTYTDAKPIDGYGPGFFRVDDERIDGPLLVLPSGVTTWNGLEDIEPLLAAAADIDVLFIGTGADPAHLPKSLRDPLEGAGIGVESMATGPAARTFNVLLGEGRRVGAALLPI